MGELFPLDNGRPMLRMKFLGGAVSRDDGFIEGFSMKRAVSAIDLIHLLPQLRDPDSDLILLRSCICIAELFFGHKTCQPNHKEKTPIYFDKELQNAVEDIVVGRGPFFRDFSGW